MPENATFTEREEGVREGACAYCGHDAIWRFLDERGSLIDVICPDCGRYAMNRAKFDEAETDIPGAEERE